MDQDPRMTLNHIIDQEALLIRQPRRDRGHGVLTSTIVHSSVTIGVFPTRIRRRKKTDVLFVQDNHVQLKQLIGPRLRTVALKRDLDSNIAAAVVIGRSESRENSPESDPSVHDGSGSGIDNETDQEPAFPNNMLALVLKQPSEQKLMFLFARDEPHGEVTFVTSTFPLPCGEHLAEQLGAYLAVDPSSSAMALAAQAGYVRFYALKTCEQLSSEFRHPRDVQIDNWSPIKSETMFQVGGIILKMEFLFPPREAEYSNFVFLLFMVALENKVQFQVYEWDSTTSARTIKLHTTHPIPTAWQHAAPSLLIPLTIPCSVMLTYENDLGTLVFWGLHQHHSDCQKASYARKANPDSQMIEDTPQSGESKTAPLWSAWIRPPRRDDYRKDLDCFFLAREDGLVTFMQVHESSRQTHRFFVSQVNHAIDGGLAAMDSGGVDSLNGRSDIIIIPGNMGDGGLYRYLPRLPVEPLDQKLNNWSFSMDWTVVPKGPRQAGQRRSHEQNDDRIFMCSGKGKDHGKLLEIRSGTEAHQISRFPFENTQNDSQPNLEVETSLLVDGQRPTGLWLLPGLDPAKPFDPTVLILSYPGYPHGQTKFHCLDDETKLDEDGREELLDLLLDANASTLAVAVTSDEIVVQITENSVRAITARLGGDLKPQKFSDLGRISHAYIDGASSTFVVSLSDPAGGLAYGSIERGSDGRAQIHVVRSITANEASQGHSAVYLCKMDESPIILAGSLAGTIDVYAFDQQTQTLTLASKFTFPSVNAVCESICLLRHSNKPQGRGNGWDCVVLCGLRDGFLQILQLRYGEDTTYSLEPFPEQIKVGDPTVYVLPDHTTQRTHAAMATSAIVVCQDTILRLSFNGPDRLRPIQHRIWKPRLESINAPQGPIFAIGQFESWLAETHSLSKVFCYIDEHAIHLVSVDESKTDNLVPQQQKLSGTPSRILYSTHLEKLIVGFGRTVAPDWSKEVPTDVVLPRMVFPMLRIVDPDGSEDVYADVPGAERRQDDEFGLAEGTVVAGKSGERIMSLLEWMPKVKDKQWSLLVVGTERSIDSGKTRIGVLTIYSLKKAASSEPASKARLEKKKRFRKEYPVYAVAAIGESSLVCGYGHTLEIVCLCETPTGLSLSSTASVQLNSDIKAISTYKDLIFISTSHHSHIVCEWTGDELLIKCHDSQARSGQTHIYLDEPGLLLGSDLESHICGLDVLRNPEDGGVKLEPAFEIPMLSPILRFHQVSPRRPKAHGVHVNQNTIIGAALNGSFYTFDVLPVEYWKLLRYIQDLAQQYNSICPATYKSNMRNQLRQPNQAIEKHINGDILSRLLDQQPSASIFLRNLVRTGPLVSKARGDHRLVEEVAEERESEFLGLATQAFSDVPPYNAYERVIGYLRDVLRPIQ